MCFLAARGVTTSFRNIRQKPNLPTWKDNPSPQCSTRVFHSENALFRPGRCALVRAHRQQVPKASNLAAEHRRPHCKQDECTSSSRCAERGTRHSPSRDPLHLSDKLTISGFALTGSSLSRETWPSHVCP